MNILLIIILKMIIGTKSPNKIPRVELSITDTLVVSIVWFSALYAISIKKTKMMQEITDCII